MPTAWVQGSPLTAEVYELIDYPAKVSFNYDVDINVPFLDGNILCSKCGQKYAFLDHLGSLSELGRSLRRLVTLTSHETLIVDLLDCWI